MANKARQPGKLVPWSSFEEWCHVMQALYSEDASRVKVGFEMVRLWEFRGRIPTAVEATGNLAMLLVALKASFTSGDESEEACEDTYFEEFVERQPKATPEAAHTLRLAATMALVRFVNEMVDPEQKGAYAQPIARLASNIGLPRSLVDLRHAGTHLELPSLGLLMLAIQQSLAWLHQTYWEKGLNWMEALQRQCSQVLQNIDQEYGQFKARMEEQRDPLDQATAQLVKLVTRHLNHIEHLQISKQIQAVFAPVLSSYEFVHEPARELIVKCLSDWTNSSFNLLLKPEMAEEFKENDHSPERDGTGNSELAELLDETDAVIRRLQERKRLKQAQGGIAGWREVDDDWRPCDLGSPVNFIP